MPKKEYACYECDTHFTINYKSGDPVMYCPFCGEELVQDDSNEFDDEPDDD